MEADLAAAHQSIDPVLLGARIRNLRIAAGMTQGEVAGSDASIAYVSRIEAGKRRPELALLRTLTQRLNSSLEEVLLGVSRDQRAELLLALDYADLALRSGNANDAHERASAVLETARTSSDADLVRGALALRALAAEALGNLDDAIIDLEDLLEGPPDWDQWTRCAIALTRCYRESGDLTRACDVGEQALARLAAAGMEALDEAVQLTVTVASVYNERGDSNHAIRLCRRAARRAEEIDSPKARAAAYWNAAIMESDQGRVHSAIPLAKQALALLESEDDNRNLAKLHSQLGIFMLAGDRPDPQSAKQALERAAAQLEWSAATVIERAYNTVALARACLLLGDPDEADRLLAAVGAVDEAPLLAAECALLRGQVHGARGRVEAARHSYLEAVRTLTSVGADRAAAQMWMDLGTLLDAVGEDDAAKSAYQSAAASTGLAVPRTLIGSTA